MEQIKRSLWKRFVTIAQPYFFPNIRGGGWAMLLLLLMLLAFLFGVLFLIVSGMAFAGNHFAPALTANAIPLTIRKRTPKRKASSMISSKSMAQPAANVREKIRLGNRYKAFPQ